MTGQRWGLGPSPGLPININYKAGNMEFVIPGLIININGEQPDSQTGFSVAQLRGSPERPVCESGNPSCPSELVAGAHPPFRGCA